MEDHSELILDQSILSEGESFVAAGGTSICLKLKLHGRLLLKKQLLPQYANDSRYLELLQKEFELGYTLDHPGIPKYLEFHTNYFLMEYVDGITLTEFLKKEPQYFKDKHHLSHFTSELLNAVGYLHNKEMLHLDLKPDNIMITRIDNHVQLIDLGFCYQDSFPYSTGGTSNYSAPEEEKTTASDIYSIGKILQFVGCRKRSIIKKCLQINPKERYQSIDELQAALEPPKHRVAYSVIMLTALLIIVFMLGILTSQKPFATSRQVLQDTVSKTSGLATPSPDASQQNKSDIAQRVRQEAGHAAMAPKVQWVKSREFPNVRYPMSPKVPGENVERFPVYYNRHLVYMTQKEQEDLMKYDDDQKYQKLKIREDDTTYLRPETYP